MKVAHALRMDFMSKISRFVVIRVPQFTEILIVCRRLINCSDTSIPV